MGGGGVHISYICMNVCRYVLALQQSIIDAIQLHYHFEWYNLGLEQDKNDATEEIKPIVQLIL